MSRYLMNSAVLTREGTYEYHYVSADTAREWLARPYVSRLRFNATAEAMNVLLGVCPPINRTAVEMRVGDEALIIRLTFDAHMNDKRTLTPEFIAQNIELGVLTRRE